MKRKLILHIGTEKTGTTTIQEFLYNNRNKLKKSGIYIPLTIDMGGTGNCRKLATACMSSNNIDDHKTRLKITGVDEFNQWSDNLIKNFQSEILLADEELVIISSEHFSSRLTTESEVKALYDILSDLFDEIEVVIYLRRQDKYAVSLYSTYLKEGGTNKVILPSKIISERYDYSKICSLWENVFGSLTVRVFDRNKLLSNDLISDFSSLFNINGRSEEYLVVEETNPSISAAAQNFLTHWNTLYPKYNAGKVSEEHELVVDFLERNFRGKPRLPLKSVVLKWMESYKESNELISKKYFSHDGSIFGNNYEDYPECYSDNSQPQLELVKITLDVNNYLFNKKSGQKSEGNKH